MKRSEEISITRTEMELFSALEVMFRKQPGLLYSLKQLVKITGMNRTKLCGGFHVLYGCSIKQYQLQQRIQLAKRQLVATELPIKAIARHCGFVSEKYFFLYFKQKTGRTPGEYRKLYFRKK